MSRKRIIEAKEVDDIIRLFADDGDPEGAHGDEDDLLYRYVRAKARQGDKDALELERLIDAPGARWYA